MIHHPLARNEIAPFHSWIHRPDTHEWTRNGRRKGGQSNMYQCNIVSGDSHCIFKGRMKLEVMLSLSLD